MERFNADFFNSLETKHKISIAIKNIHLLFEKKLNNKIAEENITVSQSMTMFFLKTHTSDEINPIDLERQFGLSRPTITGILKRLEAKGFICFCESKKDRRYKQIKLTQNGFKCLERVDGTLTDMGETLCSGFSEEEIEAVYEYLLRMAQNLNSKGILRKERLGD